MNRRVLAGVDDIFFASKIRGAAEALNVTVSFARRAESLFDSAKAETPSLIILDLHSERLDPFALATSLKADAQLSDVPIVGYYSHVDSQTREKAEEAGVDHVLPRSAFTSNLSRILSGDF